VLRKSWCETGHEIGLDGTGKRIITGHNRCNGDGQGVVTALGWCVWEISRLPILYYFIISPQGGGLVSILGYLNNHHRGIQRRYWRGWPLGLSFHSTTKRHSISFLLFGLTTSALPAICPVLEVVWIKRMSTKEFLEFFPLR
jgi:hypothetical protein